VTTDPEEMQSAAWHRLYGNVSRVLAKAGIENPYGKGDYSINEDNYGWMRIQIVVQKPELFSPTIVDELRFLLKNLEGWEITLAADIAGVNEAAPPMGVTIRKREIIDGLNRDILPEVFRTYRYADSRPGTGYD